MQIREEQVLESSPLQSGTVSFQSIPTTAAGGTPLPSNHLPPLRIKNKDVVFETTLIGTVTSKSSVINILLLLSSKQTTNRHLFLFITTHNAFGIAELSSMWDACHVNLVMA